jgi:hypothetical protein
MADTAAGAGETELQTAGDPRAIFGGIEGLLAKERKITTKKYLTFYFDKPQLDPLRTEMLAVNVKSYQVGKSAVAKDFVPRYMIVMISFFPGVGLEFTKEQLAEWQNVLADIDYACDGDDELKAAVAASVDRVVRKFANFAFINIDTFQEMGEYDKSYNPRSDIKRVIDGFLDDVNFAICFTVRTFNATRGSPIVTLGWSAVAGGSHVPDHWA